MRPLLFAVLFLGPTFLPDRGPSEVHAVIVPKTVGIWKSQEWSTIAHMSTGDYGCCPFPSAVCCTDGIHCCPQNDKCDLAAGQCTSQVSNQEFHPLGKKFVWPKTLKIKGKFGSITCADKQSECPDSTTCCQLATGDWGCCPFDSAVCCSDKQHCCPKDTVCNLEQQRCQRGMNQASIKIPLQKVYAYGNVSVSDDLRLSETDCPDHKQHCNESATCCKLQSGSYGCCPFSQADCCSDGLHCCPQGYKCNVQAQKCEKA